MLDKLYNIVTGQLQGMSDAATVSALICTVIAISVAGYYITLGLLKIIEKIVGHTSTTWDDDLLTPRLLRAISQLTPALIVAMVIPRFRAALQVGKIHLPQRDGCPPGQPSRLSAFSAALGIVKRACLCSHWHENCLCSFR